MLPIKSLCQIVRHPLQESLGFGCALIFFTSVSFASVNPAILKSSVAIKAQRESAFGIQTMYGSGSILSIRKCKKVASETCMLVLTAAHVVAEYTKFLVTDYNVGPGPNDQPRLTSNWQPATLLTLLPDYDLAILELSFKDAKFVDPLPLESVSEASNIGSACYKNLSFLDYNLTPMSIAQIANEERAFQIGIPMSGSVDLVMLGDYANPLSSDEFIWDTPAANSLLKLPIFAHPASSGAIYFGCSPGTGLRPLGMIIRSHLSRNLTWLVPWSLIKSNLLVLLGEQALPTAKEWGIRYEVDYQSGHREKVYYNRSEALELRDAIGASGYAVNNLIQDVGEGHDTGDGHDTGEGHDTGGTDETVGFADIPHWQIPWPADSAALYCPKDIRKVLLRTPRASAYGVKIKLRDKVYFIDQLNNMPISNASELITQYSGNAKKLAGAIKSNSSKTPLNLFNSFKMTLNTSQEFSTPYLTQIRSGIVFGADEISLPLRVKSKIENNKVLLQSRMTTFDLSFNAQGWITGLNLFTGWYNNEMNERISRQFKLRSQNSSEIIFEEVDSADLGWIRISRQSRSWVVEWAIVETKITSNQILTTFEFPTKLAIE